MKVRNHRKKEADAAKSSATATKSDVDGNMIGDLLKGRKRKPDKTASSPVKKAKKETADSSAVAVESPQSNVNGEPKKRKADSTTKEADDKWVTKRRKTPKDESKNESKAKMNATSTGYSEINFDTDKQFNFKIVSWNVAGLRALVAKDGIEYFEHEKPDIICLQVLIF